MKNNSPRQYSLIKLTDDYKAFFLKNKKYKSKILKEEIFIYLGEIPNMKGHCVVVGHKSGKIYSGYHIEDFIEISEDET